MRARWSVSLDDERKIRCDLILPAPPTFQWVGEVIIGCLPSALVQKLFGVDTCSTLYFLVGRGSSFEFWKIWKLILKLTPPPFVAGSVE